jgi:hypothetical protein
MATTSAAIVEVTVEDPAMTLAIFVPLDTTMVPDDSDVIVGLEDRITVKLLDGVTVRLDEGVNVPDEKVAVALMAEDKVTVLAPAAVDSVTTIALVGVTDKAEEITVVAEMADDSVMVLAPAAVVRLVTHGVTP